MLQHLGACRDEIELFAHHFADTLTLAVEHRAAPSPRPITIELASRGLALALEVAERSEPVTPLPTTLDERIVAALADAAEPLPSSQIRARCRVRTATLYERLAALVRAGRIVKDGDSYHLGAE